MRKSIVLWKRRLRPVIDIAMTVSMPVLMAYELAGAAFHEYLGIAVFLLFVIHHALNFGWLKGIAKGCYPATRTIHLLASYWGFLLMSLHIGFHWNAMKSAMGRKSTRQAAGTRKILLCVAEAVIFIYGIYAFLHRGIADYLFLRNQFVFFDFSEPLAFFLLDYFSIMAMVACAGYYLMLAVRKLSGKNSRSHTAERKGRE